MTLEECTALLTPLAVACRADVDRPTFVVYARGLEDLSVALLEAAIQRSMRTRRFFPCVAELRQDAEAARLELAAAIPFVPCLACRDLRPGWMTIIDPAGDRRVDRCACWRDHQARLRGAGLSTRIPLALPEPLELQA